MYKRQASHRLVVSLRRLDVRAVVILGKAGYIILLSVLQHIGIAVSYTHLTHLVLMGTVSNLQHRSSTDSTSRIVDDTLDSRFIGSMDVDYKVHFLPDLKLHATVGADYAKGDGTVYVPDVYKRQYLRW